MNNKKYDPHPKLSKNSLVPNMNKYQEMHERALNDPDGFWLEEAKNLYWKTLNTSQIMSFNFNPKIGPIFVHFLPNSTTNACYNALDVHIENGFGDRIAYYCEGNHPDDFFVITYRELLEKVCRFANVLKKHNVKRGHTVVISMPLILEALIAALACARIGAVHSIVFAGYSPKSMAERIFDRRAKVVVTVVAFWRASKLIEQKNNVSKAAKLLETEYKYHLPRCIVLPHVNDVHSCDKYRDLVSAAWDTAVDVWWQDEYDSVEADCEVEWMDSEDPLFILYTSGTTGKPKCIVHTTGGYLTYIYSTFKYITDYRPEDVCFSTADIGWIAGHTYMLYGSLLNRATSVLFSGTPFYPESDRLWSIVESHKVSILFTAPTVIRTLMQFGDEYVKRHNRSSLRILVCSGETINREAWLWFRDVVGRGNCSVVDSYGQTETGGIMLTPFPGATPTKPGSVTLPFFGNVVALMDDDANVIEGPGEGNLAFAKPWPGLARAITNDRKLYEEIYFSKFPGYYFTGDKARRDEDGYIFMTGRIDDNVNVSGHLLSTVQIEGALMQHEAVSEAAVVGRPHPVKGQSLYCFVTLKHPHVFNETMVSELKQMVREKIGAFASPDDIQNAPSLPKNRSGKILRWILRKIAEGNEKIGDKSELINEFVVRELLKLRCP